LSILDRYIFRSVLFASLGAVGVLAFVLLVGTVAKELLGPVAAKQISIETFCRLVLMLTPGVISYVLPLGILTGILLVMGRLSAQQEITAMRAAGWGLPRIAAPILVLAALGAGAAALFNTELGPRAVSGYRVALADAVRTNPLSFIVPREFVRNFPGYVIYVAEKEGHSIRGVWIWQLDHAGRALQVIRGEHGECVFDETAEALSIRLANARVETRPARAPEEFPAEGSFAIPDFGVLPLSLSLEQMLGKKTYRRNNSQLTFSELAAKRDKVVANEGRQSAEQVFDQVVSIRYAMQSQFVLAVAVLAFAVIGVPLGIKMQRKESSANLGLALLLAMGFYLLLIIVDWLAKTPHLRPDLLLWVPNLVFGAFGLWLFRRVDRQ